MRPAIPLHASRRRRSHTPNSALVELLEDRTLLATVPSGFSETVVASSLSGATAMQFSPDGKLFIAEDAGTMEVWEGGVQLQANFFANAPISTQIFSERGLLGLAFDPDYANNRYIYVYYTTNAADNHNRVSRFTADADGELALAGSEHIVMELDPHNAGNHNGGAMHFGLDGMLYIAVGDNANQNNPGPAHNSQRLDNRHGKMLRIDVHSDDFADTGQNYGIPADNPTTFPGIAGSTSGFNQSIWAVGLRNPFTFSVEPGTGRIFINDVGQNTWEEINEGVSGVNYGWPSTEGDFNPAMFPNFTQPFYAYNHTGAQPNGCAITGGAFYTTTNSVYPAEYHGDYFFADFCGDTIWHVDVNTKEVNTFASGINAPVDLKVGEDGSLYYLARGSGQVVRIDFESTPPSVVQTQLNSVASPNRSGIEELTLQFDQSVTVASPTSLILHNHTTGQTVDLSAATLINNGTAAITWDLSNVTLPNGRYTAELPRPSAEGLTGLPIAQTQTFQFHVQAGDIDGDGNVNFNDTVPLSLNFGTTGAAPFSDGDGDGDGNVNFNDTVPLSLNFGASLDEVMYDFGDAEEGGMMYPTTLANNGARHVITGNMLFLGTNRDAEPDGNPTASANGDDTTGDADEDGVTFGTLEAGSSGIAMVESSGDGFINAWIDFDHDGNWDGPGEQILTDVPVVDGINNLQFNVPGGAVIGNAVARFRLTGSAGYSYFGLAPDGEVEDHLVTISLPDLAADTADTNPDMILSPTFATFEHPMTRFFTNLRSRLRGR